MGPDVTARQELHSTPFLAFQLSVFATSYATVNPHLFPLRLWSIPVALASTWHLCTKFAFTDPWLNTFNFGVCVVGFTMFMRLLEMAFLDEPPKYDGRLACTRQTVLCKHCLVNTISYLLDARCLHWNNDSPCFKPQDTRGDTSHLQFYIHTFYLFAKHLLIYDTFHVIIENIGTLGKPQGDTIYRHSLHFTKNLEIPFPHPALAAVLIAFMAGQVIWHSMASGHYLVTLLAAPLTWLPPTISPLSLPASALKKEWPPLYDNPLKATSIRDFWSRRWHSTFRRNFWIAGGKPGSAVGQYIGKFVGGVFENIFEPHVTDSGAEKTSRLADRWSILGMRMGAVMGVFLMSGLLHDLGMWGMGQGMDLRRVTGYFLIQGIGLIIEDALGLAQVDKQTEKADTLSVEPRVIANGNGSCSPETDIKQKSSSPSSSSPNLQSRLMTLWVFMWVVVPATMMIEAWLERGLGGVVIWPHSLSPGRRLVKLWKQFLAE
ncbi:Membrane bound O-acyl transferase family protein [Ceratobasidium theobromae]|uniref:Membrane bound O-acyl transferase family protein n=1 Tax=Ceratobasidium theobromae TaxID=1582974 RepID=A0A5N5QIB8_9AGAM|nr:Membrane bound O-acyl transferase family protein [Ceratobasidium theobromae]